MRVSRFDVAGIPAEITWKDIKHVYLRIDSRTGDVRISAPKRMSLKDLSSFVLSRLEWIRAQQTKFRRSGRRLEYQYRDGERHQIWGRSYPLRLLQPQASPSIQVHDGSILVQIHPGSDVEQRRVLFDSWLRSLVMQAAQPLFEDWQTALGVKIAGFSVRRMKTRWGSCTPRRGTIRLNTELARLSPEYLEYVVVHELMHLIEPSHNARFYQLMDRHLPQWRGLRKSLNRGLP